MGVKWTNVYYLALMTTAYVIGELAHFLINTTSRAVARDTKYGELGCYQNVSMDVINDTIAKKCPTFETETECTVHKDCEWNYTGLGLEYQVLAGPSFIAVFTIMGIVMGVTADRLSSFGRNRLMAIGVVVFSLSLMLMGFSTAFWQLAILRMGIAAGEAVCRPCGHGMIAELFDPSSRAVGNGIFSWGVYYGWGLAFVIGRYVTAADVLGYGWRASYVISAIPGIVIAVMLFFTMKDPKLDSTRYEIPPDNSSSKASTPEHVGEQGEQASDTRSYLRKLAKTFCAPPMLLLLLAAAVRHTAGYCWAYNTRLYLQSYYPRFDPTFWVLGASVGGGGFGVFFGGFFSDRLVKVLGLHSRLWVLAAFTIISTPFSVGVLYFDPPYCMISLIFYYFFAETWFAILFTVIVELADVEVKQTAIVIFLFVMNNIGGNLPVIVNPLKAAMGYREALYLVWTGGVGLSSVLFFLVSIPLWRSARRAAE